MSTLTRNSDNGIENVKKILNYMSPFLLRQLWSVIDAAHSNHILSLDDQGLANWLVEQLSDQSPLDTVELTQVNHYIYSKILLIRDIAQQD